MAKGYWVANGSVQDVEAWRCYQAANAEPIAAFGGRFLIRGAPLDQREGSLAPRIVVVEFPSLQAARACYDSPGYQQALAIRRPAGQIALAIVEGWEG
ncbi:DUF1330 domain-containing protein [Frigidibacter oleivorans]|uniref:DUF1330 domain-containing protein n=1 Tax=Frigidibacter oleivorans TaxID=2487129 RepID=UPI000F8DE100|nr:DUF1330 domain-containing protein [Frigidibacter oleivorans]